MNPERQEQSPRQTEQNRETKRNPPRSPEGQIRSADAAKALLSGAPVREFSPKTLEELAAQIGNSAMLALLKQGASEPAQVAFCMPEREPGTAPAMLPETDCPLAAPRGLAAGMAAGAGFDIAGLRT